jgi:hypothetical protein
MDISSKKKRARDSLMNCNRAQNKANNSKRGKRKMLEHQDI